MNSKTFASGQLAQKYQVPLAVVERLFEEETNAVLSQARITAFVPIFAARRVEERLQRTVRASGAAELRAA